MVFQIIFSDSSYSFVMPKYRFWKNMNVMDELLCMVKGKYTIEFLG